MPSQAATRATTTTIANTQRQEAGRRASRRGRARSGSRCPTIPTTRRSPCRGPPRRSSPRRSPGSRAPAAPRSDALQDPGGDQHLPARRERAEQRGRGEPEQARDEHHAAPVDVAEGAAGDDQRAERQQVRVHHPLQAAELEIEVATDRRQRNRDDARLQKRRSRAEDDGGERPAPARRRVTQRLVVQRRAGRRRRCSLWAQPTSAGCGAGVRTPAFDAKRASRGDTAHTE